MIEPPYELLFFDLLSARLPLSDEDKRMRQRLAKGFQGEAKVAQSIADAGLSDHYLTDLWLPKGCQIDGLLVFPQALMLLEVKHYSGHFRYRGFDSLLNGYPFESDIVLQANRARQLLHQTLASQHLSHPPIQAYVVFADEGIALEDVPANVLSWPQWLAVMEGLSREEVVPNYLTDHLAAYQGQNPHAPRALTFYERQALAPGIRCAHCHALSSHCSLYKFRCPHCGASEPKSRAYLRTLYEYALLHHDRAFTRQDLAHFIGEDASLDLISRLCAHYLTPVCRGRHAKYVLDNPRHAYLDLINGRCQYVVGQKSTRTHRSSQ